MSGSQASESGTGTDFSAVVLAGGTAARLDGADKALVEYRGRRLVEHALDALLDAREVVVVGDPTPLERPVTFTREDPRHGGPVAGLLTGRDALLRHTTLVAVVAVDMPHLTPATWRRLRVAVEGHDGARLVDGRGRHPLAFVVRTDRLDAVRPDHEEQHGMAVHELLTRLDLADVPSQDDEHRDIDTWADLTRG
ncbi:molybdenum cofactor guanylyltransferase [Nocardioides acrostichi]|uniref:Molybdenum cofactor guanylyltransferase n=1 Tax=Nocardioides acrostichi TaxID=2784339 RepID=A0A930V4L3_9ACTN|nr:molybdenum cofactor guanylyltransferase [Nocardioides acrostichi]MBF4163741.1 molybdenum cofactor guanylyltransferase [Nocardioides acrostichi]